MSSDSCSDLEFSVTNDSSGSEESKEETDDEEYNVVCSRFAPYEDEPLAGEDEDDDQDEEDDEVDEDGLSRTVLASRYERTDPVNSWCQCEHCRDDMLEGSLEFRCCREVINAVGKLSFDGSIERIKCITEHEDYVALTNRTVLLQVAPLLRDKNGRAYRRRTGVSQNEFVRAVAYRWIIRWLCGYRGWENTRPLPACIYNDLRMRYQTAQARGYRDAN